VLAGIPVFLLLCREDEVPAGDGWLSRPELEVQAGLRFPKRRAEWRLGRWIAKRAVATALGKDLPAAGVEIRADHDGAPQAWAGDRPMPVSISISHREGRGLCAVVLDPAVAVGCDLELIEPRSDAFVADYFTDAERAFVRASGPNGRALAANLLWSAKESALKALREGLRIDTRSVEVHFPRLVGLSEWTAFEARYAATTLQGWSALAGDLVLTVASAHRLVTPILLLT
jgi:4'-phosphopantetheinyl transferase